MEAFSFSIPQNITVGKGSLSLLGEIAKKMSGKKAFIISGPHLEKMGMVEKCTRMLQDACIDTATFSDTEGNPGTDTVSKATKAFIESGADFIVAMGGGSPLDVAKAVAVLAKYGGNIVEYEGGGKVPGPVIPMIAIPTTAGTGSEVTAFSVITDHERQYKLTVVSNYLLPAYAILDSELISSVPERTAAACGVDAMVHALEAYLSLGATPVSDMFALKALELIGKNIRGYVANRSSSEASEGMLLGSLLAGIAFSQARLGNVHAMSHPVSAIFDVPHGVANAILLPTVVEYNALADNGKYYDIYRCVAKCPVKKEEFTQELLVTELKKLNAELGIPARLRDVKVTEDFFYKMSDDAMKSCNILVNPRSTTKRDIIRLYQNAF